MAGRFISYMAPGFPATLFESIAERLDVDLVLDTTQSGPPPDDDPFADGRFDLGWICSTSFVDLTLRSDDPSIQLAGNGGNGEFASPYGSNGDVPIVGDWDGDGIDTPGLYRNGTFFLRNDFAGGVAQITMTNVGTSTDRPVAGDWDGGRHRHRRLLPAINPPVLPEEHQHRLWDRHHHQHLGQRNRTPVHRELQRLDRT